MAVIVCSEDQVEGCVFLPFIRMRYEGADAWIGFSPHEAHAHGAFFGWIMPTIRTSEFTVLQIVGLDAAVVCPLFVCVE